MRKNVLIVNTPTYIGGSEVSILTLASNLTREAYAPYVVTSGVGPFLSKARSLGLPSSTMSFPWFSRKRPWGYLGSIARLSMLLRSERIHIVHTNCDHCLPYVQRACTLLKTPYVAHVRDRVRGWFQPARLNALNHARAIVVSSRAMAQDCVDAGVTGAPVLTIYNPVDLNQFRRSAPEASSAVRRELTIPLDAPIVGLVGQVLPLKGHAEFVRAALEIASSHPDSHFVVVGQPPPEEQHQRFLADLKTLVANSSLAQRLHFTGFRDDVASMLQAIDILAVPSWIEPFGRVAVEGMAAGCAVIASNVDGLPEIVTDGVDGLLVTPKDTADLAAAMSRLLDDANLRRRLAEVGRESSSRFSIDMHVRQIERLYDRVIDGTPVAEWGTERFARTSGRGTAGARG